MGVLESKGRHPDVFTGLPDVQRSALLYEAGQVGPFDVLHFNERRIANVVTRVDAEQSHDAPASNARGRGRRDTQTDEAGQTSPGRVALGREAARRRKKNSSGRRQGLRPPAQSSGPVARGGEKALAANTL